MAKRGSVLVLGVKIGGILASADLYESGLRTYITDSAPPISGPMGILDKAFPATGCSICILSPDLVESDRQPNIEMLACMQHAVTENCILYMGLRAFGRGFDENVRLGKREYGIKYIMDRHGKTTENPKTDNFFIWYDDSLDGVKSFEVNMLILSSAFVPQPRIGELIGAQVVAVDDYGLFKFRDDPPFLVNSTILEIFMAGTFTRPVDVTDAVTQGRAAADKAA